jgi:hypothetical protein
MHEYVKCREGVRSVEEGGKVCEECTGDVSGKRRLESREMVSQVRM